MPVNAQYSVATLRSLAVKITGYQRRKMFKVFLAIGTKSSATILT